MQVALASGQMVWMPMHERGRDRGKHVGWYQTGAYESVLEEKGNTLGQLTVGLQLGHSCARTGEEGPCALGLVCLRTWVSSWILLTWIRRLGWPGFLKLGPCARPKIGFKIGPLMGLHGPLGLGSKKQNNKRKNKITRYSKNKYGINKNLKRTQINKNETILK